MFKNFSKILIICISVSSSCRFTFVNVHKHSRRLSHSSYITDLSVKCMLCPFVVTNITVTEVASTYGSEENDRSKAVDSRLEGPVHTCGLTKTHNLRKRRKCCEESGP